MGPLRPACLGAQPESPTTVIQRRGRDGPGATPEHRTGTNLATPRAHAVGAASTTDDGTVRRALTSPDTAHEARDCGLAYKPAASYATAIAQTGLEEAPALERGSTARPVADCTLRKAQTLTDATTLSIPQWSTEL